MEIVVGLLGAGLGFTLVRLWFVDRMLQRVAATVLEQSKALDKMADLMVQSGEILLTVVNGRD